jgi:hypothetical protein
MVASITTRTKVKCGQQRPVCVYAICEALGIHVRFNNINMEGMYQRGTPPRIHLSARRPLARRVYNCAHELGHHVFGHGSSIDELREDTKAFIKDPKEFLADAFAGFLLMPTLGMRHAFAQRKWDPQSATPRQMFTVACNFGVGYRTLVTHLSAGTGTITKNRAELLLKTQPSDIRAAILGAPSKSPLILADAHITAPTLDCEVGTYVMLPSGARPEGNALSYERDLLDGSLFRATRSGIVRLEGTNGFSLFVRVSRAEYVGLAQYRHLEDDPDE